MASGGATRVCRSTCAFCHAGMSRGRLAGSAKKAKTDVIGYGTHCAVWNECRMIEVGSRGRECGVNVAKAPGHGAPSLVLDGLAIEWT